MDTDLILANCQIALVGLLGEISGARRSIIEESLKGLFPTAVATPAVGILAFVNGATQEALILGPNAINYTAAKLEHLRTAELREWYQKLFADGLLPEHITPSMELGSYSNMPQPLKHLQETAGGAFDAGFSKDELVGMAVRKIYRHDASTVDVRLENNFQGLEKYHGSVKIESESALQWQAAFELLVAYAKLVVEITHKLDYGPAAQIRSKAL
jgi:hypothetical protein